RSVRSLAAPAALLFVIPLAAQQAPLPIAAGAVASPIRTGAVAPDGSEVGLWASGERYKVHFGDRMTFYPYVGPELPHQPISWRTISVRAGDHELLARDRQPLPSHDEWRCSYDHGAIVELYEVRAEGLEQSFVLAERPPAGELVVTGALTTPLRLPTAAGEHGPLSLQLADGREAVRYGAAVCIDAAGHTTPMTTEVDGERIRLCVPAAVIASAVFPLVIDPLIATTLLGSGAMVSEVDVLHETATATGVQGRMWVAESRTVAAGDNDVRLYRLGSNFGGTPVEVYREISSWDATQPRLAFAGGAQKAVLVFAADYINGRFLIVHRHDVVDMSLSTSASVVPTAGDSHWRPDLGGRGSLAGNRVLIVFQREAVMPFAETATSQVWATVYDASVFGNPFVVPPFALRPLANRDQERPVVNQAAATPDWLVAFQEHNGNIVNDDWDIEVMAVDGNGTIGPTPLGTEEAADASRHKVGPQLAGGGGRFVLTYATRTFEQALPKPTSAEGQVLRAQRIDWDLATNTGSRPHPAVDLFAPGTVTLRGTGIAFDAGSADHWCASLRHDPTTSYRVYKLGFTGNVVESGTFPLATGATPANLAVTFNAEARSFPLVFAENDGSAGNNLLQASQLQYDAVTPPTLLGFSCGSGVWGDTTAIALHQQLGAQGMPLQLTGAPQDLAAVLFVSTVAFPIPADGLGAPGCVLYPDLNLPNYLGSVGLTITGGAASTRLDLPESLPPMTLTMQWVYLTPGANPLGLQASQGLTVQVGR
ncbi:MAG: hypothetical protein MUC36_29030, partial [Planctomycetes bacterium]|nr:hypothetical protein [Planctomycetota bacterium]